MVLLYLGARRISCGMGERERERERKRDKVRDGGTERKREKERERERERDTPIASIDLLYGNCIYRVPKLILQNSR